MKIITSFNSAPIKANRWGIKDKFEDTIFINALSLLSLNEHYKDVTAYVDSELYSVFEDFPCTIIEHDFNEISTKHWVNSKFEILKLQTEPFVHFDTDIFLKRKMHFNPLMDAVFERQEKDTYKKHYKEQVDFFKVIGADIFKSTTTYSPPSLSINCGTMGFFNMSFLQDYIKEYDNLFNLFLKNEKKFDYYKKKSYEPAVVMEQYLLSVMVHKKMHALRVSDKNPFNVQFILDEISDIKNFEKGNEIGYIHYFGSKKYKEIQHIKETLENKYNYYYHEINKSI